MDVTLAQARTRVLRDDKLLMLVLEQCTLAGLAAAVRACKRWAALGRNRLCELREEKEEAEERQELAHFRALAENCDCWQDALGGYCSLCSKVGELERKVKARESRCTGHFQINLER